MMRYRNTDGKIENVSFFLMHPAIFSFQRTAKTIGHRAMKGLLHLVAGLFLVIGVVTGSMAHAAEIGVFKSATVTVDGCSGFSKETKETARQGKDSSTDDGKSPVKLHGCHGHHVGIAVEPAPGESLAVKFVIMPDGPSTGIAPPTFFGTFRLPFA